MLSAHLELDRAFALAELIVRWYPPYNTGYMGAGIGEGGGLGGHGGGRRRLLNESSIIRRRNSMASGSC